MPIDSIMPMKESAPRVREVNGNLPVCPPFVPVGRCTCVRVSCFAKAIYLLLNETCMSRYLGGNNCARMDYSSITYWNVSMEMLRKIMSNAIIRLNQGGSFTEGASSDSLARTALMTMGTIKGKTRIGNNSSRARVAAAIAEN